MKLTNGGLLCGLMMGSTGDIHPRNSQTLTNAGYNATLTWANPALITLESQMQTPLFSEHPVEQGIDESNQDAVLQRIVDEPRYDVLFQAAFPEQGSPVNFANIIDAIACFVRGMTSFNSAFDRYQLGIKRHFPPPPDGARSCFSVKTWNVFIVMVAITLPAPMWIAPSLLWSVRFTIQGFTMWAGMVIFR